MKRISLQSMDFHNNVHPELARIREHDPFHRGKLSTMVDLWLVTRYEDVDRLLTSDDLRKNPFSGGLVSSLLQRALPGTIKTLTTSLLMQDPPDHRRLRRLVQRAFTPRTAHQLEERILELTNELIDNLPKNETFDLIEHFALPLPIRIIAEMVGVPEEDLDEFKRLAHAVTQPLSPTNMHKLLPPLREFSAYIQELAEQRRAEPREDLLSLLVQAEEDGDKLTHDELVSMIFTILVAGHETTVSLIANGTLALLDHPEQRDLLFSDVDAHLDNTIEEILRFDGPLIATELYFAKRPIEGHGKTIPEGARVMMSVLAANRDPTIFDAPNTFDITRDNRRQIAFGKGIHYCLGAPLARLEGKIALSSLFERAPTLKLAESKEALRYLPTWMLNKLERLPVIIPS